MNPSVNIQLMLTLTLGTSVVYFVRTWGFEGTTTNVPWVFTRILKLAHHVPGTRCGRCDGDHSECMVRAEARKQKTAGQDHRDTPRD